MRQPIDIIQPQHPDGSFDLLCEDYGDLDEKIQEYIYLESISDGHYLVMSDTNAMMFESALQNLTEWLYHNYPAVVLRIDTAIIKQRLKELT